MTHKNLIIAIPEELHRRLKLHSVESGRDMKQIVQQLIEEYLSKVEKKKTKR